MKRRTFSREFKLEAVKLVTERGVSVLPACRDLELAENVLRRWMHEAATAPATAFPGNGQQRAGNVRDRAMGTPLVRETMARPAMERFFSAPKTGRAARRVHRTRDAARADVFDHIERFDNPPRANPNSAI